MIYTTGFMITFVQVISIAMKKNRSVIITKQGAPVALLLVVALVAACGLLSCSHGGDARGGDAHPSDSLAEALGNQIFTDYYNYYDASSVAKHGDDFNDNVDDSYADGHDTAAPADDDQDPDGTTAVPHDKIRGNASEAESLISLFNGMDNWCHRPAQCCQQGHRLQQDLCQLCHRDQVVPGAGLLEGWQARQGPLDV